MAIAANFTHVDMGGVTLLCRNVKTGFQVPGQGFTTQTAATSTFVNSGSSFTMTKDNCWGSVVNINTVASTVTLPAATGTGDVYQVQIGTSTTSNHVVQAAGSDKIFGVAAVGGTTGGIFTVNNNTTFTMSSTTTGGLKGGSLIFTDSGTNFWTVEANLVGTGTVATPISA